MNNSITQLSNNPINEQNINEKIYDIHERIYQWVIQVINFTKKLPNTPQNLIIIPQIVASVSSVGANDQEANAANSKKDFHAKYSIARKESKETQYWLRVIKDTNSDSFGNEIQDFLQEGKEISFIISSIMNKTHQT